MINEIRSLHSICADDIALSGRSTEEVEITLESWRCITEMKVNRSNIVQLCMNKNDDDKVQLQDIELI